MDMKLHWSLFLVGLATASAFSVDNWQDENKGIRQADVDTLYEHDMAGEVKRVPRLNVGRGDLSAYGKYEDDRDEEEKRSAFYRFNRRYQGSGRGAAYFRFNRNSLNDLLEDETKRSAFYRFNRNAHDAYLHNILGDTQQRSAYYRFNRGNDDYGTKRSPYYRFNREIPEVERTINFGNEKRTRLLFGEDEKRDMTFGKDEKQISGSESIVTKEHDMDGKRRILFGKEDDDKRGRDPFEGDTEGVPAMSSDGIIDGYKRSAWHRFNKRFEDKSDGEILECECDVTHPEAVQLRSKDQEGESWTGRTKLYESKGQCRCDRILESKHDGTQMNVESEAGAQGTV